MPRYIDADALKDVIQQHDYPLADRLNSIDNGMFTLGIFQAIDQMPTVSPDEVRGVGKWDRVETEFGLRCPKCGKLLDEYVNGGEWVALSEIPNYCPNCGAKMEVSEDA